MLCPLIEPIVYSSVLCMPQHYEFTVIRLLLWVDGVGWRRMRAKHQIQSIQVAIHPPPSSLITWIHSFSRPSIQIQFMEMARPLTGPVDFCVGYTSSLTYVYKDESATDRRETWRPVAEVLEFWKPSKPQPRSSLRKFMHRADKRDKTPEPPTDPRITILQSLFDADLAASLNESASTALRHETTGSVKDFACLLS
jgi:hypothetical protein